MNGTTAYILAQSLVTSVIAGISSYSVSGQTLTITTTDGKKLYMNFPDPVGVKDIKRSATDHLIIVDDEDKEYDCGLIPSANNIIKIGGDQPAPTDPYVLWIDEKDNGTDVPVDNIATDTDLDNIFSDSISGGSSGDGVAGDSDLDSIFG